MNPVRSLSLLAQKYLGPRTAESVRAAQDLPAAQAYPDVSYQPAKRFLPNSQSDDPFLHTLVLRPDDPRTKKQFP